METSKEDDVSMCSCDGPSHPYDPSWCGEGKRSSDGKPIDPGVAAAKLELQAALLRAQAVRGR